MKKNANMGSLLQNRLRFIESYHLSIRVREIGTVHSVGDGIIWIEGLPSAAIDELLIVGESSRALVFHLTQNLVGAILLEQADFLTSGMKVRHSGFRLSIGVGDELLGRVVDPLGNPLDGDPPPEIEQRVEIDVPSPDITSRDFVNEPLFTGNKIVDNLFPIGKGQRQLLIGDNGLGKSSFAIDTVINQNDKNVLCVYVLIGQKRSTVINTIEMLKDTGAFAHTVIVAAEATAFPGLQYLAPFAGCSIAEYWMKRKRDTLIVYDDLTAHANSYRELSLLLRRPPGREAYPADIFYLHSRLLERSTCLSHSLGGGSMTALPIIETRAGELTSYIPTNLISITDGQIFFDAKLFAGGFLPAIDITKSVSRVGGKAQLNEIKREAGRMKLDYLQFLELEVFTRFGAKLDVQTQKKINRGRILREIFKQGRLNPLPIEFQMAWMVAFNDGLFDDSPTDSMEPILEILLRNMEKDPLPLSAGRHVWSEKVRRWIANENNPDIAEQNEDAGEQNE